MIITCSQCHTRFKVGDDKLASGPIRVRCSKCNFVFMASREAALAVASQPASVSLPATTVSQVPAAAAFVPPSSPTPRPSAGPITGMFNAFAAPSDAAPTGGFGAPSNRSGIFRAPTSDFRAPPSDPFAGMAPPAPTAPPAKPASPPMAPPPMAASQSPFGTGQDLLARAMTPTGRDDRVDPFASVAPPSAPDPFANIGLPSAPDPFGGAAPFGGTAPIGSTAASPSPFASSAPAADPFAGLPTAAATPHAKDPFGLGASPAPSSSPPGFAPGWAQGQPQSNASEAPALTEPYIAADLFGAGARPATDPFGSQASAPNAGAGNSSVDDPFAALDAAGSADSMVPTGPPGPPPEESDPFADLGMDDAPSASLDASDDPFDRPPAKAAPPAAPRPAQTGPPRPAASVGETLAPLPSADRAKLQRLEAAQRVRAVAWGAAQLAIFAAFLTVAVVLGRGGTLDDLGRGDLAAALGGPRVDGDLAIERARLRKRTLPSGLDVVIISGEVRNTTQSAVPGAKVEVKLGAGPPVSGWAWSTLDGVDLALVASAEALGTLGARTPSSASLAPGERAPFVVVGPAPADGLSASFSVQAVAPPLAPP